MPRVREFLLPDLGEGLTEAEIVRWLVQVGDDVEVDQPVAEVETAKSAVELPCPFAGQIRALHGKPGEALSVGEALVTVTTAEPDELERAVDSGVFEDSMVSEDSAMVSEDSEVREVDGNGPVLVGYGSTPEPVHPPGPVPVSSPAVRRLAREHGVDLSSLTGTGPGRVITRADVLAAGAADDGATRIPWSERERVATERFTRSRREIPDVTCWLEADATALVAAKEELAAGDPPIGLLALLARACVDGLARHPRLNSTVDALRRETVLRPDVHLGIATQTGRGLVVPVVREANRLSTEALAGELARATEAARRGVLAPAELTGGTFTLNNYGALGVDGATPILNHPEAAMFGIGRITDGVRPHGGRPAVRKVVQLSLTFDHRACDGAEAAGLLRFVADRVERPWLLLRDR
jgi:2-oxoisovalerate dehydrogenase E2 component (dihydrolipoyl transacylase)